FVFLVVYRSWVDLALGSLLGPVSLLPLIAAGQFPAACCDIVARMSRYIHKRHNVSVLLYHIVCPAKYRRVVFTPTVDKKVKETCLEISKRYEMAFIEIGTRRPRALFGAVGASVQSEKDRADHQEYHCSRN